MKEINRKVVSLVLLLLALLPLEVTGQVIRGVVRDALTKEPLPLVDVVYNSSHHVQTGLQGEYRLKARRGKLTFRFLGYNTQVVKTSKKNEVVDIYLEPFAAGELHDAVVVGKKNKYSRKNNPAVELMRKVIAAKQASDLQRHAYYSYDKYSRLTMALNDVNENTFKEGRLKKFEFLLDHTEINNATGRRILPISVDERLEKIIYRQHPKAEKTIVEGQRTEGLNNYFNTGDILTGMLQEFFTDVNIYKDDIYLLRRQFTSPLSKRTAISFYRYYIMDTVRVNGEPAIHLDFTPNNPQDFGFSGALYVAADSTYRVLKARLTIPHSSDVNFVESMTVLQSFELLPSGDQVLRSDDMMIELKATNFLQKFLIKRQTEMSHFSFAEISNRRFKIEGDEWIDPKAEMRSEKYWAKVRHAPLSNAENGMDGLMQRLSKIKGFKPVLWVAKALIENFVETSTDPEKGSKFDFGPMNTTVSHNFVNGLRFRVGGQTTANLNRHWFGKGYVAYGVEDRRVMGMGEVTYALNEKGYLPREFPVRNISVSYKNDVESPTDKFMPTDKDNVFTSFKWQKVNHMQYFERWRLGMDYEWENNVRLGWSVSKNRTEPTAALFYQPVKYALQENDHGAHQIGEMNTTDVRVSLRYSPGAKWVNTKQRRKPRSKNFPVFELSHTMGLKNVLGGEHRYNLTEVSVKKRWWLNSWGKIDTYVKAGAQWERVPFPLLCVPPANLSYIIEYDMYTMMGNMEFLNDRYVTAMASWDLNGKLFNRIPLLKRLKWREYVGCNVLWGQLTDKNNPLLEQNKQSGVLWHFPGEWQEGEWVSKTQVMQPHKPYVEMVVGVHNIFKLLHVEYVRRLTYRENLERKHRWGGVRMMLKLTF